eukprot:CAMPEP_0172909510 /NCGR_PEP_ID=MMETSP1075-20121228/182816_1 /TAXON_ID=2916 /ORGANISM="Ceratium fusus, Strain PA161109" /LENGTH=98 /DNA_ID=CAMNT_0013767473 /DNA_START=69 /DNA_END=361 /DNA_ORIENTATION=-
MACDLLLGLYRNGQVPRHSSSISLAIKTLEAAVDKFPLCGLTLGHYFSDRGNMSKAMYFFEFAAKNGWPESLVDLAGMHLKLRNIEQAKDALLRAVPA